MFHVKHFPPQVVCIISVVFSKNITKCQYAKVRRKALTYNCKTACECTFSYLSYISTSMFFCIIVLRRVLTAQAVFSSLSSTKRRFFTTARRRGNDNKWNRVWILNYSESPQTETKSCQQTRRAGDSLPLQAKESNLRLRMTSSWSHRGRLLQQTCRLRFGPNYRESASFAQKSLWPGWGLGKQLTTWKSNSAVAFPVLPLLLLLKLEFVPFCATPPESAPAGSTCWPALAESVQREPDRRTIRHTWASMH